MASPREVHLDRHLHREKHPQVQLNQNLHRRKAHAAAKERMVRCHNHSGRGGSTEVLVLEIIRKWHISLSTLSEAGFCQRGFGSGEHLYSLGICMFKTKTTPAPSERAYGKPAPYARVFGINAIIRPHGQMNPILIQSCRSQNKPLVNVDARQGKEPK